MKRRWRNGPAPGWVRTVVGAGGGGADIGFMLTGGLFAAAALELFLVPNGLFVGGWTGVALLLFYGIEVKPWLLLLVLLASLLALRSIRHRRGRSEPPRSSAGLLAFALGAMLLHPVPGVTEELLPAAVFGGLLLGIGVRLATGSGGLLDPGDVADAFGRPGTQTTWTVLLVGNAALLVVAAFAFAGEPKLAVHSLVAWVAALAVVARVFGEPRLVLTMSVNSRVSAAVAAALRAEERSVVEERPTGGKGRNEGPAAQPEAIRLSASRLEETTLRDRIRAIDPEADIRVIADWPNGEAKSPRLTESRRPE
ncbi:YitT family protein [Paenibacillus cymbidii]|uniref:YitT family protein n=1 Tax=Paenibacillus cymbidii TaxID=1639034 RepID=UPI00107FE504|nr:YitT family protein [Paenibacillus cymbidii]